MTFKPGCHLISWSLQFHSHFATSLISFFLFSCGPCLFLICYDWSFSFAPFILRFLRRFYDSWTIPAIFVPSCCWWKNADTSSWYLTLKLHEFTKFYLLEICSPSIYSDHLTACPPILNFILVGHVFSILLSWTFDLFVLSSLRLRLSISHTVSSCYGLITWTFNSHIVVDDIGA